MERGRQHAQAERDRACDDLVKAQEATRGLYPTCLEVFRKQDLLKAQVEGFGASLAKAHEEAIQEYRANFKEMNDYLDLMHNATEEYKGQLKKINPDFDTEHYDRLIL